MYKWANPYASSVKSVMVLLANASSIAWIPEAENFYIMRFFFQSITVYYSDKCLWKIKHWCWDGI